MHADPVQDFKITANRFNEFFQNIQEKAGNHHNLLFQDSLAACGWTLYSLVFILDKLDVPLQKFHGDMEILEKEKHFPKDIDGTFFEIRFWIIDFCIHSRIFMDRLTLLAFFMFLKNQNNKIPCTIPRIFNSFNAQRKAILNNSPSFKTNLMNFPSEYLNLVRDASWFDQLAKEPRDQFVHLSRLDKRHIGLSSGTKNKWDVSVPTFEPNSKSIKLLPLLIALNGYLQKYLDFLKNSTKFHEVKRP